MPNDTLHILVLLRETSDPRPPARVITRGAAISERGLRRLPNPLDLAALEEALRLKEQIGARVTVLTIGPNRLDDMVRLAYAMGADRGIRLWDHDLDGGDVVADARVLGRCIDILGPSLVFTGNRLLDRGDDPVPALAAALRSMPSISAAMALTLTKDGVEVLRISDRGGRQVVTASSPCTILFGAGGTLRYPSVDALAVALEATVEVWDTACLGLPFREIGAAGSRLASSEFNVPRPDPVRVATPDAGLPAFERILSLLSGGIKAREGRQHQLSADETADGIWRIFCEEGVAPGRMP